VLAPVIDLTTVPASTARLLAKIRRPSHRVKVRNYTSELGVPCFMANILTAGPGGVAYQDAWVENAGFAAHPDPEVAINSALLEATQTIMTSTAGAREDLVLHARSLGRHERTRARRAVAYVAWRRLAEPTQSFASVEGFVSRDARDDVRWLCTRLAERGCMHLPFADYSRPELRPAHVVRVIIPGLETINPFRTGLRARMALVEDLL
jgi:ribosomal protein S12 methylthiotransferase accessory factor